MSLQREYITRRRAPRAQSFKVTQDPVSEESPPQADQVIPIETYKQEHAKDQALTAARLALQDKSNKKRRLLRDKKSDATSQDKETQPPEHAPSIESKAVRPPSPPPVAASTSAAAAAAAAPPAATQPTQTESKVADEPTKDNANAELVTDERPKEKANGEYNEVDEFFTDNAERYQSKNEPLKPVPVLPIVVPENMRDRVRALHNATKIQRKRKASEIQESKVPEAGGSHASQAENSRGVLTTDKEAYDEAVAYEQEQEAKAKKISQENYELTCEAWTDPMLVLEYDEDIFGYLRENELETLPERDYTLDGDITWQMRGVLVDWLIEIHYMFRLLPETLFLAVNIIDRFLSKRLVSHGKVQLVGVAALFIATKFEEMTSPRVKDFLKMTDETLKEEELLKAERFVLEVLDFRLCYANPLHFLRRVTKTGAYDLHMRTLAKYFLEISCLDHRFMRIPPSKIAAASLWLAQRMLAKGQWNEESVRLSGYRAVEIKPVVQLMLDYLSHPIIHDAFFKKWESKKLLKASVFVRNWVKQYYRNQ